MSLRIFLITDNYLPHQGGSRVYCHNLLRHLKGVESSVLTRAQTGDADFDRAQPYSILRRSFGGQMDGGENGKIVRSIRLAFLHFNIFRHVSKIMRRFHPDIILAGELIPTGPVAALIAHSRCPFVLITHAEAPATLARTRLQSRVARWVCGRAKAIIVSSEIAKANLIELLGAHPDKILVLTPGVGEEHLDPAFLANPCSDLSRPPRLLSVGRLVRRKNHLEVLASLPRILEQFPSLEYTIAGSGPLEDEMKNAVKKMGLEKNVRFLGDINSATLMQEYARSDCFILPNVDDPNSGDTEGFGIVFLEASAHGLPVIGGRTGGTTEAILDEQTGLRIDGNNREAIASAILGILANPPVAQKYGREGRHYVETQMRWPDRAERLKTLLESLASGVNKQRP